MLKLLRNAIVNWLKHEKPLPHTPLSDFSRVIDEVRPGDVILVEGRSRVSEVIKLITQSSWSHAALYIGRLEDIEDEELEQHARRHFQGATDTQLIIESELGLGTVLRPLMAYECEHLRICRPRDLEPQKCQAVIAHCLGMLGSAYDVRQIFDLARFLFPWFIMPRRWRSTLFSTNPGANTQTVCSTMIAQAFGSIAFPILPLVKRIENGQLRIYRRNPRLCTPSDFDYSPYFNIIKYPFLDFSHYADQRLKPWDGPLELTEEERELYLDPAGKARQQ
jgi:Permuted papain-like amidase enzyme, YaeF/YiiX, C92 family